MEISDVVQSQYRAALAMLRQALAACPDELWNDPADRNRFWLVAYHALFYTHFYLHPTEQDFMPWAKMRRGLHDLESAGAPPYTPGELLEFIDVVNDSVRTIVPGLDWSAASGFDWLPMNKLALQFYNVRHLQAHTGELAERLWARAGVEVDWVGMG